MKRSVWVVGIAVMCLLAASGPARAQNNSPAWKELALELHVYDIKAYFTRTPIYNFARVPGTDEAAMRMNIAGVLSQAGGGGISLFDDSDPNYADETSRKARQLKDLIERLVHPKEPWEEVGGRSVIEFVTSCGLMFVYTTEDGHKQIDLLVKHILPAEKRNLAIDLEAVELDRSALGEASPAGFVARTDKQKEALKKATKKVLRATSVAGADGQVLSSENGVTGTYVSDVEPVIAENTVSWDPTVSTLSEGMLAQIQAVLNSEATEATLDYRLVLMRSVGAHEREIHSATTEQVASAGIELPTTSSDLRAGTLVLPLGCPTIVAGGTVPDALLSGNAEDEATTEVYYVATVRLLGQQAKK